MTVTQFVSPSTMASELPSWLDQQEFPFVSHFIEIEGNRIHYIDEGNGPVLLFLHGMPLWLFQYRNIIKRLRDQFRCIALDYPGFGLSAAAPGFRNTLLGNTRLLEAFIGKLNLEEITLVLHDISTPVGIGVAERNPHWMKGLVLTNGFAFPLDEYPSINLFVDFLGSKMFELLAVQFDFFTWYTVEFLSSRFIRFVSIHADPLVPRHPTTNINQGQLSRAARRAYFKPFKDRSRRHHQADFFRSVATAHDHLVQLEQQSNKLAHLPVLVSFGDADATYKAGWHQRFARMFPNHQIDIIKGAHHFPQEYAPEYFVAAINRWWREIGQPLANTATGKENSTIEAIRTRED